MAKISQLTATTSPADTDSLPIENTSGTITTKRITISSLASTIANKVRSLLSIGSASSLKTSSKEIVGAVNEVHDSVNSLIDISLDHDEALADLRDSNASLSTSVAQLNTKMTFENWSSFNNAVMRCRYAGILFLVGSASDWTLVAKQYTTILTLPEGYRPQIEIPFVADSFGSGIQISGIIKPSGELQLYPTAETSYWRFSVSFPTVG